METSMPNTAERKREGRPYLVEGQRTVPVGISVPRDLADQFYREADARGQSVSAYLREVLIIGRGAMEGAARAEALKRR